MHKYARLTLAVVAAAFAVHAHAFTIDFDSVCPTAPCPVVYEMFSGISFFPPALLIVAPGTDGLTGPLGGKYLSLPGLASGLTITFSKNMLTGSVKVSRANTTAGPVTVYASMFRNRSPVGSSSAVVNAVNQWVDLPLVPFNYGVPFDEVWIYAADSTATIGIDALQYANLCFGFTDVQWADEYCNAVEWMANRNITFGCDANHYCPNANVTRGQMALFMLRLGIAVSPKVLQADCTQASTFSTAQRSCVVAIPADTYPRVASASLACALSSANAVNKVVSSEIVRSTDGGTTWASAGQINYGALAAGKYAGLSNVATVEIEAGSLTHVAHETAHVDGDAAASILAQCKLVVTVGNRLGTMPPF